MKQYHFNVSHHCESIKNQNPEDFTCNHVIIPSRPITKCNGNCFQRGFYQQKQHQYPSHIYHPIYQMPHMIIQPEPVMPLTCNPSFNYPFHEPSYFKKMKAKQKILDPSSYRVTVRRITPLHVAVTAAEAYRAHRNKDSDKIHLEPFNQIIISPHEQFRTRQPTNLYERDYLNFDNQNIPSVPSKKIISKNNGLQVSSTSFITTTDDQKSFISDNVSEKTSEYHMIHAGTLDELSSSMTELEKSNNDSFTLSKPNSSLPITNVINAKQIESKRNSVVKEHSFVKPQSTINKAERHEEHSIKEKFTPLKFIPESTIKPSSIDNSHPPTPPSSVPPNINSIKSNEMLVKSSRSVKSITSLTNKKQKSSTDIIKSSLPLRTTRSTLDFGLLIDETTTDNF